MLSIGSFSKIAQVTTKALRYYDEIGLLKPFFVDPQTGYRFYAAQQLKDMLLINRLKGYRFSLDEITRIVQNPTDTAFFLQIMKEKEQSLVEELVTYQQLLADIKHSRLLLERGKSIMENFDNLPITLKDSAPMNLLYVREIINVKDYPQLLGKLFTGLAAQNLTILGPPMTFHHSEEYTPSHYDMEAAIPVKETTPNTRILPSTLCAFVAYKGNYQNLPGLYAAMQSWLEDEGCTLNGSPYEIYDTDPNTTPADENITQIYFPVKKQ